MNTNEIPPKNAVNMESESNLSAHEPISSHALLLWQYEFEQSLIDEQLQYQQQAVAMEASIKEAALQAAAGANEAAKLLKEETDTSMVDLVKELSSRRLIEGVELQSLDLTSKLLRSKSIPISPIRLEKEGNDEENGQSRSRETKEMRSRKGNESGSKHRSRSRERSPRSRSRSRERRRHRSGKRQRHRSRSRSKERQRSHRSRSKSRSRERRSHRSRSMERRMHRSRSSRDRRRCRSRERRRHGSKSKSRERHRHQSRSRERRSHRRRSQSMSMERQIHRSRSGSRKRRSQRSRSGKNWRRISCVSRSPPKGSSRVDSSFSGGRDSRSPSSPCRSKQDLRMESKQKNSKSLSHTQIFSPRNTKPFSTGKIVEKTKVTEGTEKTSQRSICSDDFGERESKGKEEA
ncbi:arginine/serine-rich coiled-coil protein 2-like [Punica granatum]|uniref:Arginine/serine-rich coiled-coil protein 2-like n=1 Tax=Punica granatum TaxID=22663 RepID=A0A6P8CS33_PUNGR|nr:arginine/serine-rich coiled-coil protein 2-like [Punica granatum]